MLELANTGYITATDLADHLVKNHQMSFRKAYEITSKIINYACLLYTSDAADE